MPMEEAGGGWAHDFGFFATFPRRIPRSSPVSGPKRRRFIKRFFPGRKRNPRQSYEILGQLQNPAKHIQNG